MMACFVAEFLAVCFRCDSREWARSSSFKGFLDHTQRRTTVGRTPLDEWSAHRRDLYLTTRNTHNRHQCPPGDSNPQLSRRAAADQRLRRRGHWNRLLAEYTADMQLCNFADLHTSLWLSLAKTETLCGRSHDILLLKGTKQQLSLLR